MGQFERKHAPWTPATWDDGYLDNRGRMRVYRPDYPRAYQGGYALRAHVVWWLRTGKAHPAGSELHHKDHNRQNDRFENLEPLSRSRHRKRHQPRPMARLTCETCGKEFETRAYRLKERVVKYCSQACYKARPYSPHRSENHRNAVKTHCKRGHPLSGKNLWVRDTGARICLTCKRARQRRRYHERKAES